MQAAMEHNCAHDAIKGRGDGNVKPGPCDIAARRLPAIPGGASL